MICRQPTLKTNFLISFQLQILFVKKGNGVCLNKFRILIC